MKFGPLRRPGSQRQHTLKVRYDILTILSGSSAEIVVTAPASVAPPLWDRLVYVSLQSSRRSNKVLEGGLSPLLAEGCKQKVKMLFYGVLCSFWMMNYLNLQHWAPKYAFFMAPIIVHVVFFTFKTVQKMSKWVSEWNYLLNSVKVTSAQQQSITQIPQFWRKKKKVPSCFLQRNHPMQFIQPWSHTVVSFVSHYDTDFSTA